MMKAQNERREREESWLSTEEWKAANMVERALWALAQNRKMPKGMFGLPGYVAALDKARAKGRK